MEEIISQYGIRPRPHFSSTEEHEPRLYALAQRLDRESDALLKEALEDLLARYESKAFGALLATQPSPDGDRPLVHARLLSESVAKPLCGAGDGPWSARGFDFLRVTCHECQSLVLNPSS
jgi:predicted DNA-binding protein